MKHSWWAASCIITLWQLPNLLRSPEDSFSARRVFFGQQCYIAMCTAAATRVTGAFLRRPSAIPGPEGCPCLHCCPAQQLPLHAGHRSGVSTAWWYTYLGGLSRSHIRSPHSCSREWCSPLFLSVLDRRTRFGHTRSTPGT